MANIAIRRTRATSSAVVNEGRHPRRSLTTSSPPATTTRASADTATKKLIEDRLAVLRWPRNRGLLWRTTCTTGRIWPRRPGGPDQGPERHNRSFAPLRSAKLKSARRASVDSFQMPDGDGTSASEGAAAGTGSARRLRRGRRGRSAWSYKVLRKG